jgi:hypothetical protein
MCRDHLPFISCSLDFTRANTLALAAAPNPTRAITTPDDITITMYVAPHTFRTRAGDLIVRCCSVKPAGSKRDLFFASKTMFFASKTSKKNQSRSLPAGLTLLLGQKLPAATSFPDTSLAPSSSAARSVSSAALSCATCSASSWKQTPVRYGIYPWVSSVTQGSNCR